MASSLSSVCIWARPAIAYRPDCWVVAIAPQLSEPAQRDLVAQLKEATVETAYCSVCRRLCLLVRVGLGLSESEVCALKRPRSAGSATPGNGLKW